MLTMLYLKVMDVGITLVVYLLLFFSVELQNRKELELEAESV